MKITSVKVRKIEKENSRMKGMDIRIIEGEKGLFIAMPSRKYPSGEYRDVAHPINSETRKEFEDAIIEEYNNTREESTDTESPVEE